MDKINQTEKENRRRQLVIMVFHRIVKPINKNLPKLTIWEVFLCEIL